MNVPAVTSIGEPSDAAWRRFGDLAAAALVRLAVCDAVDAQARIEAVAS
jgi:hypothetical protein